MKLVVGLAALLALASLAGGCRHSSGTATTATSTTAGSTGKNAFVAAVVGSPQAQGLPFFPSRVGSRHCTIPEGGPAGLRISGVCSARVSYRSGRFTGLPVVLLVERWQWNAFHSSGSPRRAQQHTWAFLVRPSKNVVALGQSGDFPPQNAR